MNEILIAALQNIAARGPAEMPEEPEFNSTQDAENFGAAYTSFELAELARAALAAVGLAPSALNSESPDDADQGVRDVMMQEVVGEYDVPAQVPEWVWVEKHASFRHVQNGVDGVWDFVLNLSRTFDDIPARLQPIIDKARQDGVAYLLFNQGT